jgi:hypothetical protein
LPASFRPRGRSFRVVRLVVKEVVATVIRARKKLSRSAARSKGGCGHRDPRRRRGSIRSQGATTVGPARSLWWPAPRVGRRRRTDWAGRRARLHVGALGVVAGSTLGSPRVNRIATLLHLLVLGSARFDPQSI